MTPHSPSLKDLQNRGMIAGVIGMAACVAGFFSNRPQFFQSYLYAYMIVFGLTSGSLGVLMLHLMVGGQWGLVSRASLRSGVRILPWVSILFIPILVGLHSIYPWTDPAVSATLGRKQHWLTPGFFAIRAVFYLLYLNAMGFFFLRKMKQERPDSPAEFYQGSAGLGLISFFLVVSFVAFDWTMSLEPHWASTIYGALLIMGQALSTFAFTIMSLAWIQPKSGKTFFISEKASHDIGNLMFAFTILWTYMELAQFLIMWCGNLPEEIPWYLARSKGGWDWVITFVVISQFFLPFLLLLWKRRKRDLSKLVRVALFVLTIRMVDLYWFIVPDFSPQHFRIHWLDPMTVIALGGLWFMLYCRHLQKEVAA
jgi:hypothetical protein